MNMIPIQNHNYANSFSNYYFIMIVQNLKKFSKSKLSKYFSHFRGTKCRVQANNNREAVVVYTPHVVKRASKRSALVLLKHNGIYLQCSYGRPNNLA